MTSIRTTIAVAAGLLLLPGGLAAQRFAEAELVWPPAPEEPRIGYVGELASERDVGKNQGFFARLKSALVGNAPAVLGLRRPHDVYVDEREGELRYFISDGTTGEIYVFDTGTESGWTLSATGDGRLAKPMGLGGDGRGTLYVADPTAGRTVAFDRDGTFLRAYGGDDILHNPVDVAVDPERERVYVVDSYLHQVVVFDHGGQVVGRLGKDDGDLAEKRERLEGLWGGGTPGELTPREASERASQEGHGAGRPSAADAGPRDVVSNRGTGPGEFRWPGFVAVAPDGTVYVSDQMNFRVQAFDPEGNFLRQIGQHGDGPGAFARPKGLAVDGEGHLYVADGAFNNVQIFSPEGRILMAFGDMGMGDGELWLPLGLHIDEQDRIYTADRYNGRVQIFRFFRDSSPSSRRADGEDP